MLKEERHFFMTLLCKSFIDGNRERHFFMTPALIFGSIFMKKL